MPGTRDKIVFLCDACRNESLRWEGQCPSCREWNTLVEARRPQSDGRKTWHRAGSSPPVELSQVSTEDVPRLQTSSGELDRVLGGGIVAGSLCLIAGDPGVGKSTLLLDVAGSVSSSSDKTLYVSGEESAAQIKMRADRLGIYGRNLFLLPATDLEEVLRHLDEQSPALAVVDSIQTMYDPALSSAAGTVAQIRECARRLMEWSKGHDVPIILSGHVTKGGDIAGPRVLEHMVDVVLYMEGDPISSWRLLRSTKNRFGSTNEVGVFEMTTGGLVEVEDPSRAFLSERREGAVGSVIVSTMEGSRPLLVEIQALTTPSMLPAPRRVATGVEFNRLLLVCAVLTRRAGLALANQDVLVNVTGGLRIGEPAADLGLALAIASSARNAPLADGVAAVGELSLSGEIRRVPQLDRRIREAARLGLRRCLVPVSASPGPPDTDGLKQIPVSSVGEAIKAWVSPGRSS